MNTITNPALGETLLNILAQENPGVVFLQLILHNLIILIFIIAATVFFFMLIWGGIQWMTAGGDKVASEAARGRITAALIGLVIVFSVYAILKLFEQIFGFSLTQFNIERLMLE
jgi:hypothetical protein